MIHYAFTVTESFSGTYIGEMQALRMIHYTFTVTGRCLLPVTWLQPPYGLEVV